ncbi:ferric-dicitrate binding protein FerR (iron transport regulator) [Dyadobacter jejuensis]|uniref:Ferric-dicitrate binding protein FerR (Iron transport regulator) n=1 Tax=Dyadobacter jejuensis TaxID=1082580 RepID=A0A316AJF1_9BACT|nr:FecR domain-containing protein [Dyadobacter jejuensis]PWJ57883.1 ferric-dicitrate binding protein FerR (iron transport regulator) [Dyadobacter jejuensis]
MQTNITKELIFKHFSGRTSFLQKQMIDEWATDLNNQELFYTWLDEYEQLYPEYTAGLDAAVEKYYARIHSAPASFHEDTPVQPNHSAAIWQRHSFATWLVAASTVLLLGFLAFQTTSFWLYKTYQTTAGEIKSLTLSDGSQVTLNGNSLLRVPRWGFGEHSRKVFLMGEADFSVTHTQSNQKFIVETSKQFDVEVLGTEFTVFARERGSKVVLNKGMVRMNVEKENTKKTITLKPGDKVTLDNANNEAIQHLAHPEVHSKWKDHRFIFEKTTLLELSYILEDNYGIDTKIDNKDLLDLTISGAFTAHSDDELLDLISNLLDLNIIKKDKQIIISKRNL